MYAFWAKHITVQTKITIYRKIVKRVLTYGIIIGEKQKKIQQKWISPEEPAKIKTGTCTKWRNYKIQDMAMHNGRKNRNKTISVARARKEDGRR